MPSNLDTDGSAVVVRCLKAYRRYLQKRGLLDQSLSADIILKDICETLRLQPNEIKSVFGRYKVVPHSMIEILAWMFSPDDKPIKPSKRRQNLKR